VVQQVDIAMPCATQNEVEAADVAALVEAGMTILCEGANMPCTSDAISLLHEKKVEFGPAKACNAGGVAVSALEMSQNSQRLQWTTEEVDGRLKDIMRSIYKSCDTAAREYDTSLQAGANIAGFLKVALAMDAQGVV
jgi:glutamate dehydrogenase (NADP+)